MNQCQTLEDALRLATLLHGPFSYDQLQDPRSRIHLYTQLEELYWHITDEYSGPGSNISQFDLYKLFFESTDTIWHDCLPTYSDINNWLQDYNTHTKSIPVYGALILNYTLDKVLLVGTRIKDRTMVYTPARGKRDQGETPAQTAIREVAEETGLNIEPFLLPDEYVKFENKGRPIQLFIVISPCSGNEKIPQPKRRDNFTPLIEVNELKWFNLHDERLVALARLNVTALRLLLSWSHSKIRTPTLNKKAAQAVPLRPIQTLTGQRYHFDPKCLNENFNPNNYNFPTIYQQVMAYTPVCAGLLSLHFTSDLDYQTNACFCSGPAHKETFGNPYFDDFNNNNYANTNNNNINNNNNNTNNGNKNGRARNNSNSRRHSPPPQTDYQPAGKVVSATTLITTKPYHAPPPEIAGLGVDVDELFRTQISLDDVFDQNAIATAEPPQLPSPTPNENLHASTSSTSSNALPIETRSAYSQPFSSSSTTTTTTTTATATATVSNTSIPLSHLVPPRVGVAPTTTRPKSFHPPSSTTAPSAPVIVAPVPPSTSSLANSQSLSKLNNLKMKVKGPVAPLQPLPPLAPK